MMIQELYKLYSEFFLVDTDTRKIRKNSIFFALKGDNFNGNKFVSQAFDKGATYCVIDEEEFLVDGCILVDDVLETLQELATYHRRKLNIPIIALTGSNGKTTTKELINSVLSTKYNITATVGNLNNHIGVPLTLLSMNLDTEIGVIEMGANHHKEIAFLSNIVQPDFGYITNFGKAHLEGFGSIEGVIEAKSELYNYLIKKDKKIFVNPNDEIQVKKTNDSCNSVLFDDSIEFLEVNPFVKIKYKDVEIQSNLIGKYNFNNIAAVITIAVSFDVSVNNIKEAIEAYVPKNNRSQVIKTDSNEIILDAYNANPTSMNVALENFSLLRKSSKVIILGDMFELGKSSNEEHQKIVDLTSTLTFDTVFYVGDNFFQTKTNNLKFKNFEDFKGYLKKNPIKDSFILIKGSRGMALERVLDLLG